MLKVGDPTELMQSVLQDSLPANEDVQNDKSVDISIRQDYSESIPKFI
jgi:hypothetical protein